MRSAFSCECCWRFKSSETWFCVHGSVLDILKDCTAFIFQGQAVLEECTFCAAWPWRWRHDDPLKCQVLLTQNTAFHPKRLESLLQNLFAVKCCPSIYITFTRLFSSNCILVHIICAFEKCNSVLDSKTWLIGFKRPHNNAARSKRGHTV